jgi:hypothetical protein
MLTLAFVFINTHDPRYRDVFLKGDCDATARKVAEKLGWLDELNTVMAQEACKFNPNASLAAVDDELEKIPSSRKSEIQQAAVDATPHSAAAAAPAPPSPPNGAGSESDGDPALHADGGITTAPDLAEAATDGGSAAGPAAANTVVSPDVAHLSGVWRGTITSALFEGVDGPPSPFEVVLSLMSRKVRLRTRKLVRICIGVCCRCKNSHCCLLLLYPDKHVVP